MALLRYQEPQIVVEIADLVIGNTVIKRKARFDSLHYSQTTPQSTPGPFPGSVSTTPAQEVVIMVTILSFAANADGSYGESLEGKPGFASYTRPLRATNTTLVDASTGVVIGEATLLNDPAATQDAYTDGFGVQHPAGVLHGKDYMYEDEFFRRLASNMPVIVDDLIGQYMVSASANGRY